MSAIEGEWEAFVTKVVKDPIPGCAEALVIAGSMPRGTIYGLYDISEQIGVSPWYFWADVATPRNSEIYVSRGQKTQGPPTVKYRGFFINDEQPGLTNWVSNNWADAWNGAAGYNREFYALVAELMLRLRANYLWPAIWGSMVYTDDPFNQPTLYAYEVVLGSSHTEPLMRAQNEFATYYEGQGPWAYNENNETIDEYFRYGVQRAKPYARNSLWTMAMRGSGDTAIEGLGIEVIVEMLETLVHNQREIMAEGLGVDDITEVPQLWCLYKEVQSYLEEGLVVPEDITLLWSDDNRGNLRRLPLTNETDREGGAGVYYHFDYVGGPRNFKWINAVDLTKTAEQMQKAHARKADRIWIVNVGDIKPLEIPISHFLDMAYDADRWTVDRTGEWIEAWAAREFGARRSSDIASVLRQYSLLAGRRNYELVARNTYSLINYNEADAVMGQWTGLEERARRIHDSLPPRQRPAFFQLLLHPVRAGRILHEIYITAARNALYAGQKRNAANDMADRARELLDEDADLTDEWDGILDGKWESMLDRKSSPFILLSLFTLLFFSCLFIFFLFYLALAKVIEGEQKEEEEEGEEDSMNKEMEADARRNSHQLRRLLAAAHARLPAAPDLRPGSAHSPARKRAPRRRGVQRERAGRRQVPRELERDAQPTAHGQVRPADAVVRRLLGGHGRGVRVEGGGGRAVASPQRRAGRRGHQAQGHEGARVGGLGRRARGRRHGHHQRRVALPPVGQGQVQQRQRVDHRGAHRRADDPGLVRGRLRRVGRPRGD